MLLRIKLFIKRLQKKDWVRLAVCSLVLALLLIAMRGQSGVANNLSDLFYAAGTVFVIAGAVRYIRNVGLFKTFPYMAYKRRYRHAAKRGIQQEEHPMSLAEFNERVIMDETRHKPVAWPLITGTICWGISYLFVLFV